MELFASWKKNKFELAEEQKKWNKMLEMWGEGHVDSPYAELLTYQGEINNGGHDQYFTNIENTNDLQKEMSALETILPEKLKYNLQQAYRAYLILEEKEDKSANEIIEQCDNVFYDCEEEIEHILEEYANKIEL